jgi:hypothetical protein
MRRLHENTRPEMGHGRLKGLLDYHIQQLRVSWSEE